MRLRGSCSVKAISSTIENVNGERDLRQLSIAPTATAEQVAIVRFLDHADRRIRRYIRAQQKLIALLEEQKQAIIHQAVTGQIDVRTGQAYPASGVLSGWGTCRRIGKEHRLKAFLLRPMRNDSLFKKKDAFQAAFRWSTSADIYQNSRVWNSDRPCRLLVWSKPRQTK